MLVMVRWRRCSVAVPLSQIEGVAVDAETEQVLCDWHYWCARGHQF